MPVFKIVDEHGRWLTDMRLGRGVWKPGIGSRVGGTRSRSSKCDRPARRRHSSFVDMSRTTSALSPHTASLVRAGRRAQHPTGQA
jgi:hypothetical protein